MSDIVERLRDRAANKPTHSVVGYEDISDEAASEIERLRSELEQARAGGPRPEMSCDEMLAEAEWLASNIGYVVVPDPVQADGFVHEPRFVAQIRPTLRVMGFDVVPMSGHGAPYQDADGKEQK